MAKSIQIFEKVEVGDLEVKHIYMDLMQAATNKDSIYIKAKESMEDYLAGSDLSARDKAKMLSELISTLAAQMTSVTLTTALKMATENRDAPYNLAQIEEAVKMSQEQRDKIATDAELTEASIEKMAADAVAGTISNWRTQADIWWASGIDTTGLDPEVNKTLPPSTGLPNIEFGEKYSSLALADAKTYDAWTSSYRQNGRLDYTNTGSHLDEVIDTVTGNKAGLMKAQTNVSIRQEIGFDDNMRQHAANSSANMVGLLVSSDAVHGSEMDCPLELWSNAMKYLIEDPAGCAP
jgi:hypothetical protein